MRIAATVVVVLVASGCASRQNDPAAGVSRSAAPVKYESTVTTYFDLTSRTPPAQRKLQFGEPEASNCRILASSGGHLGWVVPVVYETSAPPPPQPVVLPAAQPKIEAPPKPSAKGKPAKGKQARGKPKKGESAAPELALASLPPTGATAVAAAVTTAAAVSPDSGVATLDNVSVTGKTRYFFWFDRENINAVTKRMDICP